MHVDIRPSDIFFHYIHIRLLFRVLNILVYLTCTQSFSQFVFDLQTKLMIIITEKFDCFNFVCGCIKIGVTCR